AGRFGIDLDHPVGHLGARAVEDDHFGEQPVVEVAVDVAAHGDSEPAQQHRGRDHRGQQHGARDELFTADEIDQQEQR
ncbi:hypothetical protein DQE80_17890, partial [Enterococcus sp. HPCN18]